MEPWAGRRRRPWSVGEKPPVCGSGVDPQTRILPSVPPPCGVAETTSRTPNLHPKLHPHLCRPLHLHAPLRPNFADHRSLPRKHLPPDAHQEFRPFYFPNPYPLLHPWRSSSFWILLLISRAEDSPRAPSLQLAVTPLTLQSSSPRPFPINEGPWLFSSFPRSPRSLHQQ